MDSIVDNCWAASSLDGSREELQLHQLNCDFRIALLNLQSDLTAKSRAQCLTNVSRVLIITALQISDISEVACSLL